MVFVGNINGSIENLVKVSHLLSPFPKDMIDTAFFDRFHHYLPGWEIPKMRPEFFTDSYGFISDYFSECLREMRKRSFSDAIQKYFRLGKDLNQRDVMLSRRLSVVYLNCYSPMVISERRCSSLLGICPCWA
jgi:ATP-dependent Lon protease